MSTLRFLERRQLERLLKMASGYVLNFSDRTFADFVADSVQKDINDPAYRAHGSSKANRLRTFLEIESDQTVGVLLTALADYAASEYQFSVDDKDLLACRAVAERLLGGAHPQPAVVPEPPQATMYNFFVSGRGDAWDGRPFILERDRCLEFTEKEIQSRFGQLEQSAIETVTSLPCVFAYESHWNIAPAYGRLLRVIPRERGVRFEYEVWADGFMSSADLSGRLSELSIDRLELGRHHWAIKEVNLLNRLGRMGISLPSRRPGFVDISTHQFDVALSFAGETRSFVEQVTWGLDRELGRQRYFYDNHYKAQLARPSLDALLEDIYRNRSRLIVAFIGADYEKKDWCGLEFRMVREIILTRQHERVMYIRMDDAPVTGVLKTDGYIDARNHSPEEVATFIKDRLDALQR